jgi:hypothetical protein
MEQYGWTTAERRAEDVLIQHQRRDIKGCTCGEWGSDHGHIGQSHTAHIIAELRKAGLVIVEARR